MYVTMRISHSKKKIFYIIDCDYDLLLKEAANHTQEGLLQYQWYLKKDGKETPIKDAIYVRLILTNEDILKNQSTYEGAELYCKYGLNCEYITKSVILSSSYEQMLPSCSHIYDFDMISDLSGTDFSYIYKDENGKEYLSQSFDYEKRIVGFKRISGQPNVKPIKETKSTSGVKGHIGYDFCFNCFPDDAPKYGEKLSYKDDPIFGASFFLEYIPFLNGIEFLYSEDIGMTYCDDRKAYLSDLISVSYDEKNGFLLAVNKNNLYKCPFDTVYLNIKEYYLDIEHKEPYYLDPQLVSEKDFFDFIKENPYSFNILDNVHAQTTAYCIFRPEELVN